MKKLLPLLLLIASSVSAQTTFSTGGNITAGSASCSVGNNCVTMQLPGTTASVSVTLSGTFVATAVYEKSSDGGTTWVTVDTQTAVGNNTYAIAAQSNFRVRGSAYTSGNMGVTITASAASSSGGLGNVTLTGTASSGQVPTATSPTAATWQTPASAAAMGPTFNVVGNYGAVGDGSTDNSTAFANAATAINAYSPKTLTETPILFIPGGSNGATATYNYASGLSFTQAVTIQCGPGAILNYTGSAHAADIGPTGLTPTNQTAAQIVAQYTIRGCGWTGGASMTQGVYFNNETAYNVFDDNRFFNFGPGTSTIFGVYFSGDNYDMLFSNNHYYSDNNTARNWVKVVNGTSNGNSQFRGTGNTFLNYNFAAGSGAGYAATVAGIGFWIDGAWGGYFQNNNMGFCGPCVRIGPNSQGFSIIRNNMETIQSGSTHPVIEYGNPATATFVDGLHIQDLYVNAHTVTGVVGPGSATTGLTNASFKNIYISNFVSPVVIQNNVASQTGNTFGDIQQATTFTIPYSQVTPYSGNLNTSGSNIASWDNSGANYTSGFIWSHYVNAAMASSTADVTATNPGDAQTFPNRGFTMRHYPSGTAVDGFLSWENNYQFQWYTTTSNTANLQLSLLNGGNLAFARTKGQHFNQFAANSDEVGTCTFAATTCTVTFTAAFTATPVCSATDQTAAAPVRSAPTTSNVVFTGGTGAGTTDVVGYLCRANPN